MSGPTTPTTTPAPAPAVATAALPRWGIQTGLIQRRQGAFYLFVVLAVIGGLTVLDKEVGYLAQVPTVWLFSVLLIALVAAPVAVAIYLLDQFEREPISMLVGAFVWGALVALAFALYTEPPLHRFLVGIGVPNAWATPLYAASLEEAYKYLGIVVLFLVARHEFDDLFDGFVYGAMIGLGFDA
jgi:RsiW-degrading membrane proteinase PrsW (M82 family)